MKTHILHVIYKLSTGGLEGGLINLVNTLPKGEFHHTILSLTDEDSFANRIIQDNVDIICLRKKPGPLFAYFLNIHKIMKQIKPDILHTRNLATLECQVMGWAARIPYRIHSEHGRDMSDVHGLNRKSILLRRWLRPFVHDYVALSKDLEGYLTQTIGAPKDKCIQIYNGVDTTKFSPKRRARTEPFVILTAGRLDPVKDLPTLLEGFARFHKKVKDTQLWIVGDGSQRQSLEQYAKELGISKHVRFWGTRADLPQLMKKAHLYAQTSLYEGISNTVLEAMSSGLCVVATAVGGNPELIEHQKSGILIEPKRSDVLAQAFLDLCEQDSKRSTFGEYARNEVCARFSLEIMSQRYYRLYTSKREASCVA